MGIKGWMSALYFNDVKPQVYSISGHIKGPCQSFCKLTFDGAWRRNFDQKHSLQKHYVTWPCSIHLTHLLHRSEYPHNCWSLLTYSWRKPVVMAIPVMETWLLCQPNKFSLSVEKLKRYI